MVSFLARPSEPSLSAQQGSRMSRVAKVGIALAACLFAGCTNPFTPAGYVGYVTKNPFFLPAHYYEVQTGPTSTGLGWRLFVNNVSITPQTTTEVFQGPTAVLAKDNLK